MTDRRACSRGARACRGSGRATPHSTCRHFSTHRTFWNPEGRYQYWTDLGSDVDGINYQGDPAWDIGEYQARIVDTLSQFGRQGNAHKLRSFEVETWYATKQAKWKPSTRRSYRGSANIRITRARRAASDRIFRLRTRR
jgi:hypothetical protein